MYVDLHADLPPSWRKGATQHGERLRLLPCRNGLHSEIPGNSKGALIQNKLKFCT